MDAPIPLTIIGGFLGAGKTTLLRRILAAPHGRRLGIAINDFGELNIDEMLVAGRTGPVVSLANGCVCCQIGDSLIEALFAMRAAADRPDGIIVEASGVADPGKIAQLGRIGHFFRLNAIAVVVDASNVRHHAADHHLADTVLRQLRAADILLLNKIDLVDDAALNAVEQWLGTVAPSQAPIRCVNAEIPVELLLGDRWESSGPDATLPRHDDARHDHAAHHHTGPHYAGPHYAGHGEHGETFHSWSFVSERPFNRSALMAILQALPARIIRGKGVLYCADAPDRQVILQLVGRRVELGTGDGWPGPRSSRLVLIGAGGELDSASLQRAFEPALI